MAKNVLISGGSRGIGAACVELFAKKGFDTAFFYKESHRQASELALKTGSLAIRADVSSHQEVLRAAAELQAAWGPVDVLINNAGISKFGLFSDLGPDEWDELFSVNVKGVYNCIQAVLPAMISRKQGSIVNLSSIWGLTGACCEAAYSASKAAVIGLSRALAKELGPSGIRVNCVAPGIIDTDMNSLLDGETLDALIDSTPLERLGSPEDVAQAVYFLASSEASFITGQVLSPNGGFLI